MSADSSHRGALAPLTWILRLAAMLSNYVQNRSRQIAHPVDAPRAVNLVAKSE